MQDALEKGNKQTTDDIVDYLRKNKPSWRATIPMHPKNGRDETKKQTKGRARTLGVKLDNRSTGVIERTNLSNFTLSLL